MGNSISQLRSQPQSPPTSLPPVGMMEEIFSKLPPINRDLPLIIYKMDKLLSGNFQLDVLMFEEGQIQALDGLNVLAKTMVKEVKGGGCSVQRLEFSAADMMIIEERHQNPDEIARRERYMNYLKELQEHEEEIKELRRQMELMQAQLGIN